MHKSRFAGFIIDSRTENLAEDAEFWSQALGLPVNPPPPDDDGKYISLKTPDNDPYVEVQKVDHDSRVHIDIETDDIEAKAARLEKLGARRIDFIKTWLVMEAPGGQRFCLVIPHRSQFEDEANTWE